MPPICRASKVQSVCGRLGGWLCRGLWKPLCLLAVVALAPWELASVIPLSPRDRT